MPKLSQKTLEKRFLCQQCAKTFRTRQGLSGHVQFKHKSGALSEKNPYMEAALNAFKVKLVAETAGFNKEEISEIRQILAFWHLFRVMIEDDHIEFNDADFKTYLIVSLSQMQANRRLLDKLKTELGTAISKLMEIQSNIAAALMRSSRS